jgi:hypothetical protein
MDGVTFRGVVAEMPMCVSHDAGLGRSMTEAERWPSCGREAWRRGKKATAVK